MRKFVTAFLILAAFGLAAPPAQAGPIAPSWVELGFKSSVNGLVYDLPYDPDGNGWPPTGAVFSSNFLATGLGTVTYTFSGAGDYYVAGFFDYQFLDEPNNNGLDDEYGVAHNFVSGTGQSYQIGDSFLSSIYSNFTLFPDPALPNLPVSDGPTEDVAVALGYAFTLAAGENRQVMFNVSQVAPRSGFYLEHNDPKSDSAIYFSQTTDDGGVPTVPDPGSSLLLLGLGLAACARGLRRRG